MLAQAAEDQDPLSVARYPRENLLPIAHRKAYRLECEAADEPARSEGCRQTTVAHDWSEHRQGITSGQTLSLLESLQHHSAEMRCHEGLAGSFEGHDDVTLVLVRGEG